VAALSSLWRADFIFKRQAGRVRIHTDRTKLDQLMERREAIYENLRAPCVLSTGRGKILRSEYEETKKSLEVEAAKVLAEMDEVTGGTPRPRSTSSDGKAAFMKGFAALAVFQPQRCGDHGTYRGRSRFLVCCASLIVWRHAQGTVRNGAPPGRAVPA